jgi:general stress protein 26
MRCSSYVAEETNMSATEPVAKIWKLMTDIGTAMLVTHTEGEDLRARPMAARVEEEDNAVYFFTDADAPKEHEIGHDSRVCLAFADPGRTRFVSVVGVAEVFADVSLAERLWRPADKAYFSDYTDPRLRVIRVTPSKGEFWEGSGILATVVSLLSAGAKQERPKMGENMKVAM